MSHYWYVSLVLVLAIPLSSFVALVPWFGVFPSLTRRLRFDEDEIILNGTAHETVCFRLWSV